MKNEMNQETLLLSRLMEYQNSDAVPFHMPGHKRQTEHVMLSSFPNPYSIDITEIEGFDNLHHPEGILKESMEWAAEVYHSDKTYYLVNGSSCGILSAVCAATHAGGKILMSRNCHKAAYHAVILNQLEPEYIYPQILDELGIQGGISASDVEKILEKGKLPEAVLIVSPTYDGIVSDVQAIAEVVHRYGIPLIVDEAHGAHFSFGMGMFPGSALDCGADLVIQSLHKTLPSFTQTAVLHLRRGRVNVDKLERYLQIFQSSSPSYLFMAGIEKCIYEMDRHGTVWMKDFASRLDQIREKLWALMHLRLLGAELSGRAGVFDVDLSKLVISCRYCYVKCSGQEMTVLSGERLSEWLREKYHLEMEMSGADYVVAITTFMDEMEALERLASALLEIDECLFSQRDYHMDIRSGMNKKMDEHTDQQMNDYVHDQTFNTICMKPAAALESDCGSLPVSECAGKISAEFIYLYPPGIPILAPGELVTEAIIDRVEYYKRLGLPVQGMADQASQYLKVLA